MSNSTENSVDNEGKENHVVLKEFDYRVKRFQLLTGF